MIVYEYPVIEGKEHIKMNSEKWQLDIFQILN